MFIEKIPEASKWAYLHKMVDQENANVRENDDTFLRPLRGGEYESKMIKELGFDQKIADLKSRNIYFKIYQHYDETIRGYRRNYAFIAAFGDTAVRTAKYFIPGMTDLHGSIGATLKFISENEQQFNLAATPEVDNVYINEFMLPNLQALVQASKNLVGVVDDYQVALNKQFVKKKHLITPGSQEQQADLSLGK